MKIRSCRRYGLLLVAAMAIVVVTAGPTPWDHLIAAERAKKVPTEPIRITADKLVTDNRTQTAVFSGHVTAVQENTKLTADHMTIFYKSTGGEASDGTSDIERLEARGQVRIAFDDKLAVSNQAVYIIEERKLILEGPDSKVVSGQNEIVGTRITFFRNDGRMILESENGGQVKAVIHSDQRGLN